MGAIIRCSLNESGTDYKPITRGVKVIGIDKSGYRQIAWYGMQNSTLSKHLWWAEMCTFYSVEQEECGKSEGLNEGVSRMKLMVKCMVGMNGWCDGQHSVFVHSFSRHAYMRMCAMVCVCVEECDGGKHLQWCVACG